MPRGKELLLIRMQEILYLLPFAVNSEANARRIALVESCFGTAGQPLAVPGRVLVGEGVLTKACRKKPKPRQFFLFNDLLVYGNIIISKKKYNKQHIIPLEEVKLRSLEDEGIFMNGWLICARGKSFAVYAATATEKQEWMAHIEKCVKDLIEKSGKKPPSESERAAVWVPDTAAPNCMVCKKVQFTMLNRRVSGVMLYSVADVLRYPRRLFLSEKSFFSITVESADKSFAEGALVTRPSCPTCRRSRSGFATSATGR